MKFSVLLPTRNRLDLLSRAIETVRRQNYDDWEIIVSDNCSEEDVFGYLSSLEDDRIKYYKTEKFLPVTDNWNNAIDKSDGDFVIMLGDDDCLMQGYFTTLKSIIIQNKYPELIYTGAFLYAYPGVLKDHPQGFLHCYDSRKIYNNNHESFFLSQNEALKYLNDSLDFRVTFDYNMQFSVVSRKLIDKMKVHGNFYQSPYPDYYASNMLLMEANTTLVVPLPLVTIGISPKSFGYYYFNNAENDGVKFLQNVPDVDIVTKLNDIILPGTNMNTSWLLAMEIISDKLNVVVNYSRYRELQIRAIYSALFKKVDGADVECTKLIRKITLKEKLKFQFIYSILFNYCPIRYHKKIAQWIITGGKSHVAKPMKIVKGKFENIIDVYNNVNPADFV